MHPTFSAAVQGCPLLSESRRAELLALGDVMEEGEQIALALDLERAMRERGGIYASATGEALALERKAKALKRTQAEEKEEGNLPSFDA